MCGNVRIPLHTRPMQSRPPLQRQLFGYSVSEVDLLLDAYERSIAQLGQRVQDQAEELARQTAEPAPAPAPPATAAPRPENEPPQPAPRGPAASPAPSLSRRVLGGYSRGAADALLRDLHGRVAAAEAEAHDLRAALQEALSRISTQSEREHELTALRTEAFAAAAKVEELARRRARRTEQAAVQRAAGIVRAAEVRTQQMRKEMEQDQERTRSQVVQVEGLQEQAQSAVDMAMRSLERTLYDLSLPLQRSAVVPPGEDPSPLG